MRDRDKDTERDKDTNEGRKNYIETERQTKTNPQRCPLYLALAFLVLHI